MTDIYKKRSWDLEAIKKAWVYLQLPEDMTGLSFLDIGCWCGGFVKEAEQRGASRALGIDYMTSPHLHDIDFLQMDVFSEKFLQVEQFDIVLCKGVLYHVENPLSFIFRLKSKTKQKLFLESLIKHDDDNKPYMYLLPNNDTNWWQPTVSCVEQMLAAAEFHNIKSYHIKCHEKNSVSVETGEDHRWRAWFSAEPANNTCRRLFPRSRVFLSQ